MNNNLRGDGERVGSKRDAKEVLGQKYAVVSIVAPEGTRQKAKNVCIKIRGVFATEAQATERVQELWEIDPDFDIFIIDMYEWIVIPPPIEFANEIKMKYNQEKLGPIMEGYYKQQDRAKKDMEQRVNRAKTRARKEMRAMREAKKVKAVNENEKEEKEES
jgi:hypothetical protein